MSRIPKKLHQIWIGYNEPPEWCVQFGKKMQEMHPDWEYTLWTHDMIFNDVYKDDVFLQSYITDPEGFKWAFISDRIRLLILRDYGGVYCDLDAKPIRSFNLILDQLSDQHTFFAGMKPSSTIRTLIDCTVYGSIPNSRIIEACLAEYRDLDWAHGCQVFNDLIVREFGLDVALFNYKAFYDGKIGPETIVLHDVPETRLFSWRDPSTNLKNPKN